MRVSRTLTRENSAAAKNAFAATRRRISSTRSSTKAIMDGVILTFQRVWKCYVAGSGWHFKFFNTGGTGEHRVKLFGLAGYHFGMETVELTKWRDCHATDYSGSARN